MKKIAIIIAPVDFRDEEYFIPKNVFETEGFLVETFSSKSCEALGAYGGVVEVKKDISQLRAGQWDAVIFAGGSGALAYLDNEPLYQIARDVVEKGKLLGAICISPVILAKAGVLKNKKATVWSSPMDKSAIKMLKENNADYTAKPVVADAKIITANGPQSARKFAETIVRLLTNK